MIELRILGSTELRHDDGSLEHSFLTGSKRLGLLVYLVLARPRGYHRRDLLLPLFWPECGQKQARNALSNMLYHIRCVLGDDVLIRRGTEEIGVRTGSLWCDATAFEEAMEQNRPERALDLYRGNLLEGFHVSNAAPEFDHWLDAERERLRTYATDAAWTLSEQAEQAGDWKAARAWAKTAAGFMPFDEEAHGRLMRLLKRLGDRAGALEAYEELKARLQREWELAPSSELTALARDISASPSAEEPPPQFEENNSAPSENIDANDRRYPSVAVLPFENFSPEENNDYLSDGITEELIHRLAEIRNLHVAARTSSFCFKGRDSDIHEIAQKLRVSHVLEGSVRKSGTQVRVTAQLIEVTSGYQLWSERYQHTLEDVFAIQDEISEKLVEALQVELIDANRPTGHPVPESPTAYDLYLRGRYFFNQRTKEALRKSINSFERAITHDPNFARAYTGLADSYLVLGSSSFGTLPPQDALDRAQETAERALALDDGLGEAHVSLGVVRMRQYDWAGAQDRFEKAIDLDPDYAEAHQRLGWLRALLGDFDRALSSLHRAEELDPLSLPIKTAIGRVYHFMRRPNDAIVHYRRALDIAPNYRRSHIALGLSLLYKEQYSEAIACFQKMRSHDTPFSTALLAFAHALAGQQERARNLLDEVTNRTGREYTPLIPLGWIHMGLGETDRAFDLLEQAVERSSPASAMKVEPLLDPVRSDPRFQRLLEKVGLAEPAPIP